MEKESTLLPLKDIILPAEPSYWPLAPIWWVLIIAILILIFVLIKFISKKLKQSAQQKKLIQGYEEIIQAFQNHKNKHRLSVDSSSYLRRIVHFKIPHSKASTLNGDKWLEYLSNNNIHGAILKKDFGMVLTTGAFNPNIDYDAEKFNQTVSNWIKQALQNTNKSNKKKNKIKNTKQGLNDV